MKFFIFGTARSGTTALAACLTYEWPGGMIQEPTSLLSGGQKHIKDITSTMSFPETLDHFPTFNGLDLPLRSPQVTHNFLNSLYKRFIGIKHVWNNNTFEVNTHIIQFLTCFQTVAPLRVIYMARRNALASNLSSQLVEQSSIYQLSDKYTTGDKEDTISQLRREVDEFKYSAVNIQEIHENAIKEKAINIAFLSLLRKCNVKLVLYEDFYNCSIDRKIENMKSVTDFLGIKYTTLNERVVKRRYLNDMKQHNDTILKKLPNYNEYLELEAQYPELSNVPYDKYL